MDIKLIKFSNNMHRIIEFLEDKYNKNREEIINEAVNNSYGESLESIIYNSVREYYHEDITGDE